VVVTIGAPLWQRVRSGRSRSEAADAH
jgi:hypothetical protein